MADRISAGDNWLDRAIGVVAPRVALRRRRARIASQLLARHYEAATTGSRTQKWARSSVDANEAVRPALAKLREYARDLVRNNGHAENALGTIADQAVSWGIVPTEEHPAWKLWADSTAIDADGRNDMTGLQKLVMRTMAESGEVLVRRRWRRLEEGFPLPVQLQILEPDYLDHFKDAALPGGGRIVQGVEFDALGRRAAYWLYREHPGSSLLGGGAGLSSVRVPATEVLHVYKQQRAGQVRGITWFAAVLLRFRDFDEYEDATLMKQKIAACLAVITTDADGSGGALGSPDATQTPEVDSLEPGMIMNVPPGREIHVVEPPAVGEYGDYSEVSLRAIAAGLGVTYEDLTGDYGTLSFSAARMSRLRHWDRVEDWRWRILVPQFLNPVWAWAMEAAALMGLPTPAPTTGWTAPPMPMIEPDKEGLAIQRNIRIGIQTPSEAIRERGYKPETFLRELADDFRKFVELGLVLDCDPRQMTQAGQLQGSAAAAAPAATAAPSADEAEAKDAAPARSARRARRGR